MKNLKYTAIVLVLPVLHSCLAVKEYQRPEKEVASEQAFRTDHIPQDSLSSANLSWKEIFRDDKLTGYIQQALDNNLDIRIALKNIDAAEAYLKQGKAAYFPTISGNASYTYANPSLNGPQGIGLDKRTDLNQYELSAGLSWEADIWGKIRSNEKATAATYMQTISAHQAVKSELVAAVASSYYQLLALDEQKRIIQETIQNLEESLETMRLLKVAGNVTEVAVQQTEAQLLNGKSLLVDTDNQIKLTENSFCMLLGENPHQIDRNSLAQQELNEKLNTGIPVELLSNRPDVMAAEYGLINAFELTNAARSNFYPSLRLSASGGLQSLEFDKLFNANSLFASLVGSLTQPILNARQVRTQYEVSRARQEQSLLTYKKTILNASREVSDALFTYDSNSQKAVLKQSEYEAYNNAYNYSEELLKYGMATYLDVLTAKGNALNAQLGLVNSEFGKLNAVVQLYRAIGGGWR
jgi:NodT family efflux transporter outer membrane factor (OMF) lipoprotein